MENSGDILVHASENPRASAADTAAGATTAGPCAGEVMMRTREQLEGEIRYAIRLTQRTARLYRNLQVFGVFVATVGSSATISAVAQLAPPALGMMGAAALTLAGAALLSIRPADKAAANEADLRRYEALKVKAHSLDNEALALAIDESHRGGAQEIEALRLVAYNDVAREFNRADMLQPLSLRQRLLAVLA